MKFIILALLVVEVVHAGKKCNDFLGGKKCRKLIDKKGESCEDTYFSSLCKKKCGKCNNDPISALEDQIKALEDDLANGQEAVSKCPLGYEEYNGRCIKFVDTEVTYDEARRECEYSLVVPRTKAECDYIQANTKAYTNGWGVWIGADDIGVEGTFVTNKNQPLDMKLFGTGQPDDHQKNEDCAHVWKDQGGVLNDLPCTYKVSYMCEIPFVTKAFKCRDGYEEYNGRCIKFVAKEVTYDEARRACEYSLVVPRNKAECDYIHAKTKDVSKGWGVYIGADDIGVEGKFVTNKNQPLDMKLFGTGQPDDHQKNEDCVHMWKDHGGVLNDLPCTYKASYMCEAPFGF